MRIADVLREECIVVGVELRDKASVLHEIARLAKETPSLRNMKEQEILAGLQVCELPEAESFSKTTAILKCSLESADCFAARLITVPSRVDFGTPDCKRVNLIIFIIGPEGESREQDELISDISRALMAPGIVQELLAESTAEELRQSFLFNIQSNVHLKGWVLICFAVGGLICILYRTGVLRFIRSIL